MKMKCVATLLTVNLLFSISGIIVGQSLAILRPTTGEVFTSCTNDSVLWTSPTTTSLIKIDYSSNGGTTWTNIIAAYPASLGKYVFTPIPSLPAGVNYKLRISDYLSPTITATSDVFSVVAASYTITLQTLTGGQTVNGNSSQNIIWTTASYCQAGYNVDYSLNGGTTWTNIVTNTSSLSVSWTVPNTATTQALIRVYDVANASNIGQSSTTFTIATVTGLETSQSLSKSFSAYADYNNNDFIVRSSGFTGTIKLTVSDMIGNVVFDRYVYFQEGSVYSIPAHSLAGGVYLVGLSSDKGKNAIFKVIK